MTVAFKPLGRLKSVDAFQRTLADLGLDLPCDAEVIAGNASPLARPLHTGGATIAEGAAIAEGATIGNRFAIHPMEGWDGTPDGRPTEYTFRRWRNFGASGAKLIWGGEAVAVRHDGRANPNQLLINADTLAELAALREALVAEHTARTGSTDGLVVGLQLTHSGRFSRPNVKDRLEPRILYHHPILDRRVGIRPDDPVLGDGDIRAIIDDFVNAAALAARAGFDFVDVKHCHGYLGHEFLSAHTRPGPFGGSFENRTRFLREIVAGVRAQAPGLALGVRVSAFDTVPYRGDPERSTPGKPGPGIPEPFEALLPYRWGFGVDEHDPTQADLTEAFAFLQTLVDLDISLVNVTAGSPYYNPHIQRPALYPPSDGYEPPEDPLVGVARQMQAVRALKARFPTLVLAGSTYSYLQEFLPNVAQAAVREGWVDVVGLGRMVLPYPQMPLDILAGRPLDRKRICRTLSDCTTAPRKGLRSGCYPLDAFYKKSEEAVRLKALKG